MQHRLVHFAAVAETLKANGCVLSIFDSFYNFAQGNLRDEDSTYAGLKREICDAGWRSSEVVPPSMSSATVSS